MGQGNELVFLGTGAACGNPVFYCGCAACQEALEHPAEAKTCSSIAILGHETTLVDTAPELRLQLCREGIRGVDRVLFTHEHFDHTGGFPQLEYAQRLTRRDPLPIYASARCLAWLEAHFDWMWDVVSPHTVEPFQALEFDGVTYTALPAAHCPGAYGYLIEGGSTRMAYFPDTGPLPPAVRQRLEGIDVLIHDSTFIGRNWNPDTHTTVEGLLALGREVRAKAVYLMHCSMHFDEPRTGVQMRTWLESSCTDEMQAILPHDGMRLRF